MKEHLSQRLAELKSEFESGQNMLADLENQQSTLRNTLLRISGAIQVLEEELAKFPDSEQIQEDMSQSPSDLTESPNLRTPDEFRAALTSQK